MKQFIIKLQKPIRGIPEVLIYNEDKSFLTIVPLSEELLILFGKKLKVYYKAHTRKEKLVLDQEVREQYW